jgi:hypothetical protein
MLNDNSWLVVLFNMRSSASFACAPALLAAALAGCASVATYVTLLDPAQKFAPTEHAVILLDYPAQPHVKVALIEAQGSVGGSEAALLEEARKQAQALGADAVVRLEVDSVYQPPVRVYDPAYANMFYSRYRYPYRSFYYPPYAYSPFPYDDYRWVGGGNVQSLKAVAIKYSGDGARPAAQ